MTPFVLIIIREFQKVKKMKIVGKNIVNSKCLNSVILCYQFNSIFLSQSTTAMFTSAMVDVVEVLGEEQRKAAMPSRAREGLGSGKQGRSRGMFVVILMRTF